MARAPRRRTLRLRDSELARCDVLARRFGIEPDAVARAAFELGLGEMERAGKQSVVGGVLGALADGVEAVQKLGEAARALGGGRVEREAEPAAIVVRRRVDFR